MVSHAEPSWSEEKKSLLGDLESKNHQLEELRVKRDAMRAEQSPREVEEACDRFRKIHSLSQLLAVEMQNYAILSEEVKEERQKLTDLDNSVFWRSTRPLRSFLTRHPGFARSLRRTLKAGYWIAKRRLLKELRARKALQRGEEPEGVYIVHPGIMPGLSQQKQQQVLEKALEPPANPALPEADKPSPLFSVIIPAYMTPPRFLREVVRSVIAQTYSKWEMILYDDGSPDPAFREQLNQVAAMDGRVRLVLGEKNLGIAGASQAAAAQANGDFLAIVDHDDVLAQGALSAIVGALRKNPDADYLYTDHAMMTQEGILMSSSLKRDWSPEFFFATNYLVHFKAVRKTVFDKVGGYQGTDDLFTDGELTIKLYEAGANIQYVPGVHYFWRVHKSSTADGSVRKPKILESALAAYNDYFRRHNIPAESTCPNQLLAQGGGAYKLEFPKQPVKRAAVIVPVRKGQAVSDLFFESFAKTDVEDLPDVHFIYLENSEDAPAKPHFHTHIVASQEEVDKVLHGIDAEAFVFATAYTQFVSPAWLTEIMGYLAISPRIGAVGGKVLNTFLTIEASGTRLYPGLPTMYKGLSDDELGYWMEGVLATDVEAVSCTFMATPKGVYEEIGGVPIFNFAEGAGIPYGLKLRKAGYRVVLNPWAKVLTLRQLVLPPDLEERVMAEFGPELPQDRYYQDEFVIRAS